MAGHEFRVRKAEEYYPVGDRRGTVLMLPGRGYSCGMLLLAWTTRALQATGWTVLQAEWDLSAVPDEPRVFIEGVAQGLDEMERQTGPVPHRGEVSGNLGRSLGRRAGVPGCLAHACLQGSSACTPCRATATLWPTGSASIRLTTWLSEEPRTACGRRDSAAPGRSSRSRGPTTAWRSPTGARPCDITRASRPPWSTSLRELARRRAGAAAPGDELHLVAGGIPCTVSR